MRKLNKGRPKNLQIKSMIAGTYWGLQNLTILPKVIVREIIYYAYAHEIFKNAETSSTLYMVKNNFIKRIPKNALLLAIVNNNCDLVEFWIEKGINIKKLHFEACIEQDNLDIFKILKLHKNSEYSSAILGSNGKIFEYVCLTDIEYLLKNDVCTGYASEILAIRPEYTYELIKRIPLDKRNIILFDIIYDYGRHLTTTEANKIALRAYNASCWDLLDFIISCCKISCHAQLISGLLLNAQYESAMKLLTFVKYVNFNGALGKRFYAGINDILKIFNQFDEINTDLSETEKAIIAGASLNDKKIEPAHLYLAVQVGPLENFKYIMNKIPHHLSIEFIRKVFL